MRGVVVSLIFLLILLPVVSTLSIDETTIYTNEPLTYSSCDEKAVVTNCGTTKTARLSQSCTLYSADNFSCSVPKIQRENKTLQEIRVLDFTSSLENALLLTTPRTPEELAYELHARAALNNSVDEKLLEQLKLLRDEKLKCWPKKDCSLETTANILYHLSQANVSTERRVYNDALLWIESRQTPTSANDWVVEFEANEGVECSVVSDDVTIQTATIPESDDVDITFDYKVGELLNFTCSNDYCITLRNEFGDVYYDSCQEDIGESLFYGMDGGCFYEYSPKSCSTSLTAQILGLPELDPVVATDARNWIKKDLERITVGGKRLLTTNELEANAYAYSSFADEKLKSWILFSQNNNGSFGDGTLDKKTKLTLLIIQSLNESMRYEHEWLDDALSWIENNYDARDLSVQTLAMLQTLQSQEQGTSFSDSLLRSDTELITTRIQSKVALNFSLMDPNDIVTLSVNTSNETYGLTLSKPTTLGTFRGKVKVFSPLREYDLEYVFENEPFITLVSDAISVYGNSGYVDVPLIKSDDAFACKLSFDDVFSTVEKEFSTQDSVQLYYETEAFSQKNITATYDCLVGSYNFSTTSFLSVRTVPHNPFTVEQVSNSDKGLAVAVQNNMPSPIEVQVRSENKYFSPVNYTLEESELRTKYFYSRRNETEDNLVFKFDGYDYKQSVVYTPPHSFPWTIVVSIAFIALLLCGLLIWYYFRSKKPDVLEQKTEIKENDKNKDGKKQVAAVSVPTQATRVVHVKGLEYDVAPLIATARNKFAQQVGVIAHKEFHSSDKLMAKTLYALDGFLGTSSASEVLRQKGYSEDEIEALQKEKKL